MEKLKQYKHIILTSVAIILLVAAYNVGQRSVLKADLQSKMKDCAKQAQLVLDNEQKKAGEDTTYSQTNHYNGLLNKCLVRLAISMSDSKGVIFSDEIRDAYEQKTLISCLSGSSVKSFCFIPGNHWSSGQAINMPEGEGEVQMRDYMSN